ncbi:MAG: hypothetical protein HY554_05645 [Elusimicrobia bacterium]|nr:hypothetical protein [Elusimicrobiota bacterium]
MRIRARLSSAKTLLCVAALLPLARPDAFGLETSAAAQLEGLGGQLFFKDVQGKNTSFTGLADWLGAYTLRLSDRDAIVATLSGQYFRRNAATPLGIGTITVTQTMSNSLVLRWLRALSASWTVKPTVAYRNELTTALPGDRLGAGLYDYHKLSGGLEAGWKGDGGAAVRQDLSIYKVDYYHYQSLRSTLPGLELVLDDRNLDFTAYEYSVAFDYPAWQEGLLTVSGQASYRRFGRQRVIESSSLGPPRNDLLGGAIVGVSQQLASWLGGALPAKSRAGVNVGYVALRSNQNNFDTGSFRFNSNFYGYREIPLGLWYSCTLARSFDVSLAYGYTRRNYVARPAQTSLGAYAGGIIHSDMHALSLGMAHPVGGGFAVKAATSLVSASSNMDYGGGYLYNYRYAYYFVGLAYSL